MIHKVFPTKPAALTVKLEGDGVWVVVGTEGYTDGIILQW